MDASAYGALFEIIAPISLIVLIGYWLQKTTDLIVTAGMSGLAMLVGTPSLVFSTLTKTELSSTLLLQVSLGAFCVCLCAIAFALLALKFLRLEPRTFLPALTMPNSGNLGLPLVLLAFGEEGLAFGIAFYFVIALFQYTVMPIVVAGIFSVKRVLKEPLIWAVVSALIVMFSDMEVPSVVADTTAILGGMMIPIMLILLGAAIARLGFGDFRKTLKLALVRLGIGLAAGLSTAFLLGTSGIASGTIVLMASMPSALVTYVLAERYDREPEKVAGLVIASTVVSLFALPLLIWGAIYIARV